MAAYLDDILPEAAQVAYPYLQHPNCQVALLCQVALFGFLSLLTIVADSSSDAGPSSGAVSARICVRMIVSLSLSLFILH